MKIIKHCLDSDIEDSSDINSSIDLLKTSESDNRLGKMKYRSIKTLSNRPNKKWNKSMLSLTKNLNKTVYDYSSKKVSSPIV